MVDEKQTSGEEGQPDKECLGACVATIPRPAPSREADKARNYRQNIMRTLRAIGTWLWRIPRGIWRFVKIGFQFADAHDGGITALATVAIVVLTIFYVSYSKKQWEEMRSARRPWLGLSERLTLKQQPSFTVTHAAISSMEGETEFIQVGMTFSGTMTNFGASPARRVYTMMQAYSLEDPKHRLRDIDCDIAEKVSQGEELPYGGTIDAPTKAIFPSIALPIEQEVITGTFAGTTHQLQSILIEGCIAYQDGFGEPHHTKVLYRSVPDSTQPAQIAIEKPLLRYQPFTEFIMEDSDSD